MRFPDSFAQNEKLVVRPCRNRNCGSSHSWLRPPTVQKSPSNRGFSLIELLIVVAVILIIAAVAIPNFMRARMASNEASAVSSCRTIFNAETTYAAHYQRGFTSTLAQLGPPSGGGTPGPDAAELLDAVLASGRKSGYVFTYSPSALAAGIYGSYSLKANPSMPNSTGVRYFYVDPSGILRVSTGAEAGPSDSPIQ